MEYDIIVIGAGSGGLNIASFMNKAGFKVLLIDKTDKSIGGDCLNTGCVPSKAIIHLAKLFHDAKQVNNFGAKCSSKADMKKIKNYIKSKQEIIREHESASWFRKQGMDVALGKASFVGKHKVKVENNVYTGKKILIATGSRPRKLNIPGTEKVDLYTNENIWDIDKLPENFLFIGGGPISIELGQAFQRLGANVTVINHGDLFLPKEEKEIAQVLYDQLIKEGMKFHFNSKPKEFTSKNELVFETNGKKEKIKFDAVFVGIGRQLNFEGLDLEMADIKTHERGIIVDEYLRTTNKNVYLCGDIVGSYQFTHAAELHTGLLLNNFFSPLKKKLNNDNLSWVTYTYPEIATFGINETEIKKRGLEYKKLVLDHEDDDRSIVDEFTSGKTVLYIDNKNKLLGGSVVHPNAGEIFQEFVLAKTADLKIDAFFNKIYAYPTASRINKKIITNLFSSKLTDLNKKMLKWLY